MERHRYVQKAKKANRLHAEWEASQRPTNVRLKKLGGLSCLPFVHKGKRMQFQKRPRPRLVLAIPMADFSSHLQAPPTPERHQANHNQSH